MSAKEGVFFYFLDISQERARFFTYHPMDDRFSEVKKMDDRGEIDVDKLITARSDAS